MDDEKIEVAVGLAQDALHRQLHMGQVTAALASALRPLCSCDSLG
jgi:hypothetical protein